jgi:hypothetical protein
MSWLPERSNPYATQTVSLAPISDEQVTDENLEPPFVRVRAGNTGFIYADSDAREDLSNPTQYVLGGGGQQFYARKLKRLALSGLQIALAIPNINARNGTVIFHSSATGLNYTVTIPEGVYATVAAGAAALQTALNSAGGSGLTFTVTVNPLQPLQITIAAAGGLYFFPVGPAFIASTMMTHGRYLFNLPRSQVPAASMTAGAVYLQYTRWFDILSSEYSLYTKNPNTSNDRGPNNLIVRVFMQAALTGVGNDGLPSSGLSLFTTDVSAETNYNRSRELAVLDINIVDEFGDPLYVPALSTGSPVNNGLTLIITSEI